jgi:hypothetical protein
MEDRKAGAATPKEVSSLPGRGILNLLLDRPAVSATLMA